MANVKNYFFGEDIKSTTPAEGISRKILAHNDNLMVCELHFEEGAVGAAHNHPHEQCTYIVSGEFEFTIGDETKVVKAGDSMYKQPNIVHGGVCLKKGVLLDIFTPCREDFLK